MGKRKGKAQKDLPRKRNYHLRTEVEKMYGKFWAFICPPAQEDILL